MPCPNSKCTGWVNPIDLIKQKDRKYYDIVYKCNKCDYTEYVPFKKDVVNNKIYVPFEKLYGINQYKVYKDDIEKFFRDKPIDRYQYFTREDGLKVAKGFIWIASHGHFATLTVEPMDGNQFEIAVRFPKKSERHMGNSDCPWYKYSGYAICNMPYVILGKDTGGH